MNRFFALFLLMVLSAFSFAPAALADGNGPDLASMSLDDLLVLRQNIESEITERLASDNSLIYPGVYLVGKDIKEGTYLITGMFSDDYGMQVLVYPSESDYENRNYDGYDLKLGEYQYVTLKTGMVLQIYLGNARVQAVEQSWKPSATEVPGK